ncbi:MAG: hypothetical protein KatS3mg030_714 [Saprospiraceae bacterium]|nr:MAG: hypothetical protein KatS3mg030_714 [Saprospiraceae bacterium]
MAKISKPKRATKGAPPAEDEAPVNLKRSADQELKPMNFKVPAAFKREFKTYATELDMSMVELLQQCFYFYKSNR